MNNLYEVLGLDKAASFDDIKAAYRKLAMKHHPDRGGDRQTFQQVQEAYEVLSDVEKRKRYDETGQARQTGPSIQDLARNSLRELLLEAIKHVNAKTDDLLSSMHRILTNEQGNIVRMIGGAERQIARNNEVKGRLKVKEGEDLLSGMLDHDSKGQQHIIGQLEESKKLINEMRSILKRYEYKVDAKPTDEMFRTFTGNEEFIKTMHKEIYGQRFKGFKGFNPG